LCERAALVFRLLELTIPTIGGDSVTVVRIVVVQTTVSVHVARVVRVAGVRGTQPCVASRAVKIATALKHII